MKKACIGVHVHAQPNQLAATLASLRQYTPASVRVILLPDGPDAETSRALESLRAFEQFPTPEPRGAPACFNRLIEYGDADILILLESGAQVTANWLGHLLAALDAHARHGLAGPSTNHSWNEQGTFPNARGDTRSIAETARLAHTRFGARWQTLGPLYSLADFCYVVRREVIHAIGGAVNVRTDMDRVGKWITTFAPRGRVGTASGHVPRTSTARRSRRGAPETNAHGLKQTNSAIKINFAGCGSRGKSRV